MDKEYKRKKVRAEKYGISVRTVDMKRKILTIITDAEMVIAMIMVTAMDSPDPRIPTILLLQAMGWLALFCWVNPDGSRDV